MNRICSIILLSLFVFATGCKNHKNNVLPSFYFWKSEFSITKTETEYLKQLGCTKLYVKFFDVDLDQEKRFPIPISVLQPADIRKTELQIIPVVFIANRVFLLPNDSMIQNLAEKVADKIREICEKGKIPIIKEIQFDCDWSLKSKDRYFEFLKNIRSEFLNKGIILSSTIRLHQVKFAIKTGIPPVDRGMLMYYNMGDINDYNTVNSILDLDKAEKYLAFIDEYPLELDVALPLYSQGVLFRRGKVVDLVNNLDEKTIAKDNLFGKIKNNLYQCQDNHYFMGKYYYKSDLLRIEETNYKNLKKAAKQLSSHLPLHNFTLSFYHLDSNFVKQYSNENLNHIVYLFD